MTKDDITEEQKWYLVNACETLEHLQIAITTIGGEEGMIPSNRQNRSFPVNRQCDAAVLIIKDGMPAKLLTRSYGIRQQALYIRYYQQLEKEYANTIGGQAAASTDPGPNGSC